jgi:anti-sigma factor RsiW
MSAAAPLDPGCCQVVEWVTDHMLGELSPTRCSCLAQHLLGCAGCNTYLLQMRATVRLVAALRADLRGGDPEPALAVAAFRAWQRLGRGA